MKSVKKHSAQKLLIGSLWLLLCTTKVSGYALDGVVARLDPSSGGSDFAMNDSNSAVADVDPFGIALTSRDDFYRESPFRDSEPTHVVHRRHAHNTSSCRHHRVRV